MNERPRFSVAARLRSFYYAIRGLRFLVQSQPNTRIHLLITACVVAAGVAVGLRNSEWCLIVLSTTVVWVAESLNTAVECLVDLATPEFHPLAGKAKDVAAGGVLLSAIGASCVGVLVFLPHIAVMCSYSS